MKRCVYCGRENSDSIKHCIYCGEDLYNSEYSDSPEVEVVDDIPNQEHHENHNHDIHCPNCGSNEIFLATRESGGFDGSNACCGYILFGPLGLLCGLAADRETVTMRRCKRCGHEF